ncbi:MAG: hypothetical protein CMA44_00220 [Euryarchaeota archaeon]|nr:hypothetical protein [Euryarchaeota archaeon]
MIFFDINQHLTTVFSRQNASEKEEKTHHFLFFSWRIKFTAQTAPLGAAMGQVLEVVLNLDDFRGRPC